MTFDEAIENINVLSAFSNVYGISPTVVRDIISKLKDEYAPTVEMTENEKEHFLSIATSSVTFTNFYEQVLKQSTNIKLGIQASPELYKHLSEKELMQAWLHPETIKVVDE